MITTEEKTKEEILVERLIEACIDPEIQLRTILPEEAKRRFWKKDFLSTYNESISYAKGEDGADQFFSSKAKELPKDMTGLYIAEAWLHNTDLSEHNISRSIISKEQLLSQKINWQGVDFTETRVQEFNNGEILDIKTSRELIKKRMESLNITSNKGLHHPFDDAVQISEDDKKCKSLYIKMVLGSAALTIAVSTILINSNFNKSSGVNIKPANTKETLEKQQTIETTAKEHGMTIEP